MQLHTVQMPLAYIAAAVQAAVFAFDRIVRRVKRVFVGAPPTYEEAADSSEADPATMQQQKANSSASTHESGSALRSIGQLMAHQMITRCATFILNIMHDLWPGLVLALWVVLSSLASASADVPPWWDNCRDSGGVLFRYGVPIWFPFLTLPSWVYTRLEVDGSWTIHPPPLEWPFQRQRFNSLQCAPRLCAFLRSQDRSSGTVEDMAPIRPSEYAMIDMDSLFNHAFSLLEYGADLARNDSRYYYAGVDALFRALERPPAVPPLFLPFPNASVAAMAAADAFERCASINGTIRVASFCDTVTHNSLNNLILLCSVDTLYRGFPEHHHFDLLTLAFGVHHPYNAPLLQALQRPWNPREEESGADEL